jgi:glycosyltransferase involved in cell wall biosynthesis
MYNNISIIIPSKDNLESLDKILKILINSIIVPAEIIVIDTADQDSEEKIKSICKQSDLIKLIKAPGSFPGKARNIGIENSNFDLIGFLDTRTVPPLNWLSSSLSLIEANPNFEGIYGKTEYFTSNEKSRIIKYATYGEKPLTTVPGLIIKKQALTKIGNFIPTTRAGEDGDWLMRLSLQKVRMMNPKNVLTYHGLDEFGLVYLFYKWYRNYKYSSSLPYLNAHKNVYYHSLVLLVLVLAFNWNWLIADWNMQSIMYIPHVTKISFSLIFLLYSIARGLILPLKKGVKFTDLLPSRWFLITLISMYLDIAKLCGFLIGSIKRKNKN